MAFMKPIVSEQVPAGDEWAYEVKYDGFRCRLDWDNDGVRLISRNGTDLSRQFPEIITACFRHQSSVGTLLPLKMDGELTVLNNAYQANFSLMQKRARLQKDKAIEEAAAARPVTFMTFDLLTCEGRLVADQTFEERKRQLVTVVNDGVLANGRIQYVPFSEDADTLWQTIFEYKAEGMVAKRKNSYYQAEKKHEDWLKVKNWRTINGFLTFYNPNNDYFTVAVYRDDEVQELGKCKHGLDDESFAVLRDIFLSRGTTEQDGYRLPPAICADIRTLDLHKGELREPEFSRLLPDQSADDCTWEQLQLDLAMLPQVIEASNTDKQFWPAPGITKRDLLVYMREIAPYMLPFLKERLLTIIRCPDGVRGESFFQKHLPDYAPDFIKGVEHDGNMHLVCNHLDALMWFANHGTMEYHIPFQTINQDKPLEIVFDLDPPGRERFSLAVEAAKQLKRILDGLRLTSFVKTSGDKGLQIHIPLPAGSMTYEETGVFTQAIAWTLEKSYPDLFTTERFKDKRGDRLYIDYLQHAEGKTIVAPYSPRKREDATVATPLFWEEVGDDLRPDMFRVDNVIERVQTHGCPFAAYFAAGEQQALDDVLAMIR